MEKYLKDIEVNQEVFEIKNSEIDVTSIMADIESNLKRRAIDKTEIERIKQLKISAETPVGHRPFDPSHVANLFEKGISPPRFSNPKYWFVKGPLKWAIHKFTDFYSLVDKKLSENRIKAFYSVVYELILLRTQYERLERKFNDLYKITLNSETENNNYQYSSMFYNHDELLSEKFSNENVRIGNLISKESKTLILLPAADNFLNLLRWNKIDFHLITDKKQQLEYIQKQLTKNIEYVESIQSFTNFKNYKNILIHSNLCLLNPKTIERIIQNILEQADKNTQVLLQFSNHTLQTISPFRENFQTYIEVDHLETYLRNLGFINICKHSVEKEEMQLITFYTK